MPKEGRRYDWPRLEAQSDDTRLPYLELDVDFQLFDDGVAIGRLNELGASNTLSSNEFLLMLLFDGSTTAREAELFVGNARDPIGEPFALTDLVSCLGAPESAFVLKQK
jgi:hypothetical protein